MTFVLGIIAALVAPFAMVLGFMIWDNHWTGSAFALNMYKCTLAGLGFAIVSIICRFNNNNNNNTQDDVHHDTIVLFPSEIFTFEAVSFLMLSSTIGILIGDWTWLEGMRILGARKVIVMDSLKPFLAAILGRIFLGEHLQFAAFGGLVLTVIGVSLVGLEKEGEGKSSSYDDDDTNDNISNNNNDDIESTEYDNLLPKEEEENQKIETKKEGNNNNDNKNNNNTNNTTKTTKRLDSYAERRRRQRKQPIRELQYGLTMSLLNVILHTFGALITKTYGYAMSTWEINLIRFGFAGICMCILSLFLQLYEKIIKRKCCHKEGDSNTTTTTTTTTTTSDDNSNTFNDNNNTNNDIWYILPKNMRQSCWIRVSMGVLFVSFLTPALTNYAMFQIALALLLTLESIGPLYSLPLSYLIQHEQPTVRASIGAFLAVAGIVILSITGE